MRQIGQIVERAATHAHRTAQALAAMRAAARVRLGMWHAVGPAVSSDPSNGVLLAIGAAGLLTGAALLAGPIGLGYVCLSAGLGLFGLGAAASVARQPETGSAEGEISRVRLLGERLERGVERLKDLQWQIRDDENRYRDLLDMPFMVRQAHHERPICG